MNTATKLHQRGTQLLESDPKKAIELFTASLELVPDAPNVLYDRAIAYARIGDHADAVADIGRLQCVAPEISRRLKAELALGAEPYVDLAREKYLTGDFASAVKNCASSHKFVGEFGFGQGPKLME